ncbi:MAG: MFS transporter [Gemmataceae bacterium]|nr:MFS transporter [Gemmataceae bacterium]
MTEAPSPPTPAEPGRARWLVIGLLVALSFMSWFNRVSMSAAGDLRLMDQLSLSPTQMGAVYSAFILAYTACMIPGGWLADRLPRGRVVVPMAAMVLGAACAGLGAVWASPDLTVVCFGLAMLAVGACEGPFWAMAVELGGRRGATAAGLFNAVNNTGGLLSPVLTPWVGQRFGWSWGIGLGSLLCLAGACAWLWIDPEQRVDDPVPAGAANRPAPPRRR